MSGMPLAERSACRIQVRGTVQGVGFRPFVHRLALRHDLGGWVRNASGEVQLALEGSSGSIAAFLAELRAEAPPLADIEDVEIAAAPPIGLTGFIIEDSAGPTGGRLPVPPDVALCAACERELADPPLSLSLHYLHGLRTAIHRHRAAALRSRPNLDARLCTMPGLRARVRHSR
jgi:hydrogenase maturation protein HypF